MTNKKRRRQQREKEKLPTTAVWQKWRFSTPQTVLCLIKHWFSVLTFVVKIATFAKPRSVAQKLQVTFFTKSLDSKQRKSKAVNS